jgi:A/G-specific adenine glycosylase
MTVGAGQMAFRDRLMRWSEGRLRSFPWRDPDASRYEVFIAEMFLRRTRAEVVADVLPRFLERYPDLDALRNATEADLAELIRPLGLQQMRARALTEIADLVEELPTAAAELRALPHVGPYVANATVCFADGRPTAIVDRNVDRVYSRYLGDRWRGADPDGQQAIAAAMLDEAAPRRYNLALLDFAAAVCTARSPACAECVMADRCVAVNT